MTPKELEMQGQKMTSKYRISDNILISIFINIMYNNFLKINSVLI
jgi:hypothetical protein